MKDSFGLVFLETLLLSISPMFFAYFGKYAFAGLVQGKTITHFGLRSGILARLYGFLYLILFILCFGCCLVLLPSYLGLGITAIIQALLLPLPGKGNVSVGLLFIGLGIFLVVLAWLLDKYVAWRYPQRTLGARQARARKIHLATTIAAWELTGLIMAMNAPLRALILVLAATTYVDLVFDVWPEDFYQPNPAQPNQGQVA